MHVDSSTYELTVGQQVAGERGGARRLLYVRVDGGAADGGECADVLKQAACEAARRGKQEACKQEACKQEALQEALQEAFQEAVHPACKHSSGRLCEVVYMSFYRWISKLKNCSVVPVHCAARMPSAAPFVAREARPL